MKIALVARHVTAPARPTDQHKTGPHQADPHCAEPHCADTYCAEHAAHVLGLGWALAGQGHRVTIYAPKSSPPMPDSAALGSRLTAQYVPARAAATVGADDAQTHLGAFGAELAARWRRTAPDVVHAFGWTSGLAALLAAREVGLPVVQTFGSLTVTEQRSGIASPHDKARQRLEGGLARAVAGVLASTTQELGDLARIGIPGSRAAVVPCGVDTAKFGPQGRAARRDERRRLLHLGPLADHRRLDALIRALAKLPATELVIAGGPAPADLDSDITCKRLGKLAAGLGVADRVSFTGRVGDNELPALLRSADVLVSAARHEPLGLTALSAMACGTPVVATSVGAYADAVIDGTTGLLLPPDRPEMLARRLRDLLATPMRVTAFGIAAADRARSRYSWDRIAAETLAAYERFGSRQAPPGADTASRASAARELAAEGKRAA